MVFDVSSITNGESAINIFGQPTPLDNDPGSTESEFNAPTDIVYDPDSNQLFVSDTGNNRIMVFDVSSITNGESAVKTIEHAQNLESIKSSLANDSRNKSKSNLFWVIILSLLVLTVLIFLIIKIIRPGK